MSDGDALLRTILMNPADDTARLVYADYLEDVSGGNDRKRAEFIRVQVEVSRLHVCNCAPGLFVAPECPVCRSVEPLWYKRSALISDIYDQFRPAVPYSWAVLMGEAHDCDTPASFVSRGFVSEIRLPLAAFMRHAEALFRAHPIERVTLTDRTALGDDGLDSGLYRSWNRDRTRTQSMWPNFFYYLPAGIFDRLKDGDLVRDGEGIEEFRRYPVYQHPAYPDLSRACVAYGRSLAGLAPVPN